MAQVTLGDRTLDWVVKLNLIKKRSNGKLMIHQEDIAVGGIHKSAIKF